MGTRKIKNRIGKKKTKRGLAITPKQILQAKLQEKKDKVREDEKSDVITLMVEGKLDSDKLGNYDHVASIARSNGWTMNRLQKAVKRVEQMLLEEKEQNKKKAKAKEKANE